MTSSLQEFMKALQKTDPRSTWGRGGGISKGEVIHTIQAEDITQVFAKYQSYEVTQNSNVSQFFLQLLPIEVENTVAEFEKKVYAEEYEFWVDKQFPRVVIYGNLNHDAVARTLLNEMFDEETTQIILSFGCGQRKILFATEPYDKDTYSYDFEVESIFTWDWKTKSVKVFANCNKEVALFVGVVFELCKDLIEYDQDFESPFAYEFDFPDYLDQLAGKKKEPIKEKKKKKVKKLDKDMNFVSFTSTKKFRHKSLEEWRYEHYMGKESVIEELPAEKEEEVAEANEEIQVEVENTEIAETPAVVEETVEKPAKVELQQRSLLKIAGLPNTGSVFDKGFGELCGEMKIKQLVGRLSRSQLEQLVVDATSHGKTITKQSILEILLPRKTKTQKRGFFGTWK